MLQPHMCKRMSNELQSHATSAGSMLEEQSKNNSPYTLTPNYNYVCQPQQEKITKGYSQPHKKIILHYQKKKKKIILPNLHNTASYHTLVIYLPATHSKVTYIYLDHWTFAARKTYS